MESSQRYRQDPDQPSAEYVARPPAPKKLTGRQWVMVLAGFVALMVGATLLNAEIEGTAGRVEEPASAVSSREESLQAALDRRWPAFGDVYRNDPRLVEQLSQAVCNVVEGAGSDEERGLAMLLIYDSLDEQTKSFFADDLDFVRFAGAVAPLRCPNAINRP